MPKDVYKKIKSIWFHMIPTHLHTNIRLFSCFNITFICSCKSLSTTKLGRALIPICCGWLRWVCLPQSILSKATFQSKRDPLRSIQIGKTRSSIWSCYIHARCRYCGYKGHIPYYNFSNQNFLITSTQVIFCFCLISFACSTWIKPFFHNADFKVFILHDETILKIFLEILFSMNTTHCKIQISL